ncbi:CZB domain-containing protein [Caulobacter sp.]|uniref:CZB domain-containing protein n=1 Tax=Caulobacter sp. TaxID=78 RepID=UPI002B49B320|nr:CZB domain-containing protein [Caulobacter sp.]HJV42561.1 CZB domain-containing protein [Caulobacter sp.]
MDFTEETHAHAQVCDHLLEAVGDKTTVDAATIRSDRHCNTGRWLFGPTQQRWAGNHTYLNCVEAHREFHQAAGEVAELINRGEYAEANRRLRNGSRLAMATSGLNTAFRRMRLAMEAVTA